MTDRPINMKAHDIRALLDGRKTQHRLVLKPSQDLGWATMYPNYVNGLRVGDKSSVEHVDLTDVNGGHPLVDSVTPYLPGDRLWCRETWATWNGVELFSGKPSSLIEYRAGKVVAIPPKGAAGDPSQWERRTADPVKPDTVKWRPSTQMPRWASRLTLIVTDVRVQRVQDISEEDARAEGVKAVGDRGPKYGFQPLDRHVIGFRNLWDSIYAKRGYGWDENPWCAALTFDVHHCNIDQMKDAS